MEIQRYIQRIERTLRTFNPIKTKKRALAWLISWKVLDVISTLLAERVHGTLMKQAEVNILANLFGSTLGWDLVIFATLPLGALMVSYFYKRMPLLVESLALFLPLVVIGNFALVIDPIYNLYISTAYLAAFVVYLVSIEYYRYIKGKPSRNPLIWETEYLGYDDKV